MKKVFVIICAVAAVLSLSAAVFADGSSQNPSSGFPQQMSGNFPQGQGPAMGGQPPVMGDEAPDMNGRPPRMDDHGQSGAAAFLDFEALLEDGVISQDTYDKILAYMEENKPDDLPEMNGEAPEMGGRPPMMSGQAPDGEAPADLPEFDGAAPEFDGEAPEFDGEAPEFAPENSFASGLLNELLEAEVITQAEYNAMLAALSQ